MMLTSFFSYNNNLFHLRVGHTVSLNYPQNTVSQVYTGTISPGKKIVPPFTEIFGLSRVTWTLFLLRDVAAEF